MEMNFYRYWQDPWVFNPDRWIENGSILPADHPNKSRIFSFSAGQRRCPGEQFGKNRIFMMVVMMLQKFKFVQAEGEPAPQTDPHNYMFGINPYKIQVQCRN